ncbi:S1C family serine protease [Nocardioides coralli]|uniref:S1C family serine protease n=1 Tax=Nocardioides coralli TaxID=2872154 RepID=UPI001CA416CC|nr:trypsin-like peptidase domain-containing protein [Nocardioides coralli]QZY28578.1 trypsin-like peptidase domain-containing protein [Nocardioides coralli]
MSDTRILPPFPDEPGREPHGAGAPVARTESLESPGQRPRGSRRFAAGMLAASLVVGGLAGFGGAAAWEAWQDEPAPLGSTTSPTVPTADADDEPAPEGSVESVAARVLPSVVQIEVQGAGGSGSGSGIVLSEDGTILTNQHVVEVAEDGGQIVVNFDDGSEAEASIVGTDRLTDTAVIQAEDVEGLTPATIGRSGSLDVGQEVVAVGSPFGLEATVTTGIVSALNRPVNVAQSADGTSTTYPAIQTDAAINPGNSGGPLVDMKGAVVGINSSIRTAASPGLGQGGAGSIGLGFAIPIDAVMPLVEQMVAGEEPTHAVLGITVGDGEAGDGAVVGEVNGGSAAASAGLDAGDVITRVDDQRITDSSALVATIRAYRPGDEVEITFVRDGEEQSATVTLDSDGS